MDVPAHNRAAWDKQVEQGNRWSVPVSAEEVARARRGDWSVVLTPVKPVPREWFGDVAGRDVLALASGGGQQAPILAAAGARVTTLDNSPAMLARDREVAEREGLSMRLELGDMRDLSRFADASFDLIFHPVSNLFVPDVRPVWRECARVLRPGGRLVAGFCNPLMFLFDEAEYDRGEFNVRYSIPFVDPALRSPEALAAKQAKGEPLEFGHTLQDQIGGQTDAGLVITALFEDGWEDHPFNRVSTCFVATLARKAPLD